MADTPRIDIDHVAKLARLALTPEERALFGEQLGGILARVEALRRVDVAGIEPSADPVLAARFPAYAVSFGQRAQ